MPRRGRGPGLGGLQASGASSDKPSIAIPVAALAALPTARAGFSARAAIASTGPGFEHGLAGLHAAKEALSARYLTSPRAIRLTAFAATSSPVPEINVVGVGIGEKTIDNIRTGVLSIKLFVRVKLPESSLATLQILPRSIQGLPIDVEEIGVLRPFGNALAPFMPNPRQQARPAAPGCSVGFAYPPPRSDMRMAGTFGALVRDAAGTLYVLSNNHVLAGEDQLATGTPIYHAGLLDMADGVQPTQIATLARAVPLATTPLTVDAAIAAATDPALLTDNILYIGKPAGTVPAEVDMVVHKFGRTTGYTAGMVSTLYTDVMVTYETGPYTFMNQMVITGLDGTRFSAAGDSGALILERKSNNATGLLFAGSDTQTLANHVDDVLQALGVEFTRRPEQSVGL